MTLKVIPLLQAFSSAIRRTFVQYFTRFQLTARSRGPSATAGLLVSHTLDVLLLQIRTTVEMLRIGGVVLLWLTDSVLCDFGKLDSNARYRLLQYQLWL